MKLYDIDRNEWLLDTARIEGSAEGLLDLLITKKVIVERAPAWTATVCAEHRAPTSVKNAMTVDSVVVCAFAGEADPECEFITTGVYLDE